MIPSYYIKTFLSVWFRHLVNQPKYYPTLLMMLFSALHYSTGAERGFGHWLQLVHSANYLILVSEYFRCILGTLRISELSVVQREVSVEVKTKAISWEVTGIILEVQNRGFMGVKTGSSRQ